MRSKIDERLERGVGRRRARASKPAKGGKVLQRLFSFLGPRDPRMIADVLESRAVPASAQPRVGPAGRALRAAPARAARARTRQATPAAKAYSRALSKAAKKVNASQPRGKRRRIRALAAPPAPAAAAWVPIGPSNIPQGQTYGTNRVDVIGRVAAIAIDPGNAKHILVGSAGGGIWESKDTGATWDVRTDQMPSLAIGAVAFDPNDAKRVYAGSGEGNFYATLGAGVYRSTDGGTTWTVLATNPFVGVGFYDLVVDPADSKTIYAATTSGFYVSTNAGASWSRKRALTCWDISVHPSGGGVELLASFEDGLFASANSGSTFTAVALPSQPAAAWTRLAVDRVTAAPDVAYVFGAAGQSAHLWRRAGTVWTKITSLPAGMNITQAWYDWYVTASPTNSKQVYLGAIDTYRGTLSGSTWSWKDITTQGSKSIHPDQHCLTFSPGSSKIIYAGNDGGIYRSPTNGSSWTALNKGLGITEVEYLASDPSTWQWIMAGTQDNGTIRYTGNTVWDHIADGDGGDCGVNQLNPNRIYHSFYRVSLERSDNKGNTWTPLSPTPTPSLFYPPVEVSVGTVGIGGVALILTRTGGPPWTSVPLGFPSGDGASAMRAVDANTFIVGSTQGRMVRAAWNGTTWSITNLTSPAARFISCIAVDPSNPSRLWVTLSQLGGGRVYRSDDGGVTWTDRTAGLPGIPMNSVVVDPANYKRVWVSADVGVYETVNLGATWTSFSAGLPNAMAADLLFHKQDRMLVCGMRNRGAWVIKVT
jgi:hypothetical protein